MEYAGIIIHWCNNGQLVKVVAHTGHKRTTRIVHHPCTRRQTQSSCCLQSISLQHTRGCDGKVVLVILIYYCSKGMFSDCKAHMKHCSKTTHRHRFIPVNEIASTIWKKCHSANQRHMISAAAIQRPNSSK